MYPMCSSRRRTGGRRRPDTMTRSLDTSGAGRWSFVANRNHGFRDYGTAAMYAPGKILVVGGGDPPQASAEVIDLNATNPGWRTVPSMSVARRHHTSTLLADGTVLVTGGTSGRATTTRSRRCCPRSCVPHLRSLDHAGQRLVPRLNHAGPRSCPMAEASWRGRAQRADVLPRSSSSRRLTSLGSLPGPERLCRRRSRTASGLTVQIAQAAGFRVTLIRLSAVTHAFNMDQRVLVLLFTPATGALDITAPAHANLAPPGPCCSWSMPTAAVGRQHRAARSHRSIHGAAPASTTLPPPAPPCARSPGRQ